MIFPGFSEEIRSSEIPANLSEVREYGFVIFRINGCDFYSNGIGVAGVNWGVTMISTKFLGIDGGYTSGAIKAVDYLTDLKARHGINVVASSNSWGGGGYSSALQGTSATTVDIGAPGSGIYSTLPGGGYGSYSGTSMATPHVSGTVALYASAFPQASAAEIRSAILGSEQPTSSLSGRTVTGGRLDVASALNAAPPVGMSIAGEVSPRATRA